MKPINTPLHRQKFLKVFFRLIAIFAILATVGFLFQKISVKESEYFWQIDPEKCVSCGRCETHCVLPTSAVKCVHAYKVCGYCDLCGGYYRPNVKKLNTAAENQLCLTGALKRTFIEEPFFEYTVNEDLCNGCGKCTKGCNSFGNGSLYLQIKQDLCKNCNECQIEKNCPAGAIKRVPASKAYDLKQSSAKRFPKPTFTSGYKYPEQHYKIPREAFWAYMDIALLVFLMSFVSWAVLRKQIRWPVILTSVISVGYFGFFRHGCVCSIGAIQNVALGLTSPSYSVPLFVLFLFILPIIFALFFGRVFCAGVCPIGALQELVNIKNYKLPKAISGVLKIFPWIYLGFAVLFAVTNSRFILCHLDPFVGIFRLGGELPLIIFGVILLIISIFSGRPFCRYICPYGAILGLFSKISFFKIKITKHECNNCQLCHNACSVDAIQPPYENKVKENRNLGVRRLLIYFLGLPVMAIIGVFVMLILSDKLSYMNKDVKLLYEMVYEHEKMQNIDIQTFYMQNGNIEDLGQRVVVIKNRFDNYSMVVGAFFGLIIALTLIKLSAKRTRKLYEIDDGDCVACGRCFSYCPQKQLE